MFHRTLVPALIAALVAFTWTAASAGANVSAGFAVPHYAFPATCDPNALVTVNLTLQNRGDAPSALASITATDDRAMLGAVQSAPQLAPGAKLSVSVPLHLISGDAWDLGGMHAIVVRIGNHTLDALHVPFPGALCVKPVATPPPAGGAAAGSGTMSARSTATSALRAALTIPPPANVRAVVSGTDCGAHVGPLGALVCPDMMKSGDLLLIWDWQSADAIDGYRVYRGTGGSATQLAGTHAGRAQTLFDVPSPSGGFAGTCYAVTAYAGKRESAHSPVFCAGGGSVAKTLRLNAVHARMSFKSHENEGANLMGDVFGADDNPALHGQSVGFSYSSAKHIVTDAFSNVVWRSAWAFDLAPVAGRSLFSAKLQLRVATSYGAGNNHSCATDVGTGSEFWWQNQAWIDGTFAYGVAPTDTGPVISADVTKIVAPWLRGEPNYGFVLKNSDENLGAFTNKSCVTSYTNPVLEVTYY